MATSEQSEVIEMVERFDYGALSYIIDNFEELRASLRPETDGHETLDMIKRYRASSCPDGTRKVTYKRVNGCGRYFARGPSLQGMAREVRNAIACPFYHDLDFQNCHPQLLRQECDRHNIPCPLLTRYCEDRDAVLGSLALPQQQQQVRSKEVAKAAVLAVINGGRGNPDRRGVAANDWYNGFEDEMRYIRERLVGRADNPYLKMAQKSKTKGGRNNNNSNNNNNNNVMGSAINHMLCDLENRMLMALRDVVEAPQPIGRAVGVLVFDGCMVEKKKTRGDQQQQVDDDAIAIEALFEAARHVEQRTGFRLSIVVKDMASNKLDVPLTVYGGSGQVPRPRYAEDDKTAARLFLHDVKDMARCCQGQVFVKDRHAWTDAPEVVSRLLLAKCLDANIMRVDARGNAAIMSGNVQPAKRIIEAVRAIMPDDPAFLDHLWQSNVGTLCFNNGIWDFRRRAFFSHEQRPDVLPRLCIPRDFPLQRPSDELLRDVRQRLLVSTLGREDVVDTYLQAMARATAGEYADKQWLVMLGERNCGKGLLQALNQAAWGPYVNTVNANAFLLQQCAAGDAAKALSWAMDCEHCRQTYTNEVKCEAGNRNIKLDGNLLKAFQSGGDPLSGRKIYRNERSFRVASKLVMNLNDIPEITPRDAAATMLLFKFPYKFVAPAELQENEREHERTGQPDVQQTADGEGGSCKAMSFYRLRDDTLKDDYCKRADVIDAFTWLVIDAYKPHPVVPCATVAGDTTSYMEDIGDELTTIRRCFVVTRKRTDFVTSAQLRAFRTGRNMSVTVLRDRLVRMGAWIDKNCCIDGVVHGRGLMGVRLVPDEEDCDM